MANALDQLREMTVVVADTGNLEAVKKYQPVDCTTNPSVVLAARCDDASKERVQAEVEKGRAAGKTAEQITDTLTVAIGAELSKLVPGRVSTEV
ncbi:MAG: transaldolase family protein, partial [Pseudomonadota bacterium]|nr:transaldolase family protein [Pseudomonadota bacterium]